MAFDVVMKAISSGFSQFELLDAIDIIIIAILLYNLIMLTKQTRAYQVLKGLGMLVLAASASQLLGLTVVSWMLDSIVKSGILVVVILFQPELRRVFEHIGRKRLFDHNVISAAADTLSRDVNELHRCILNLAKRRVGALLVFEQRTGLGDIISSGTRIDGRISAALIENIFEPNTPLHDGATIIRDHTIVASACLLPLSDDMTLARELGTRHRAALGVSGVSDSITIVVSEETGVISMAKDGKLIRYIDSKALLDLLESMYMKENEIGLFGLKRRAGNGKAK